MKKLKTFLLILIGFMLMVPSMSWATQYKFTITSEDLMSVDILNYDFTTSTPYPIGTRKMTAYYGSNPVDEYYSHTGDPTFIGEMNFGDWHLVDFNLWGYGGSEAAGWGETELYTPTSPSTSSTQWSTTYITEPQSGNTVLQYYLNTGNYTDGLPFNNYPDVSFSFIADVNDSDLTVWFGGTLNNGASFVSPYRTIKYQGAIQLSGTPVPVSVPEPATLLLVGFALIGLGTMIYNRRTSS